MKLTVHHDAAGFLAVAGAFLSRAEAENSIISIPAGRMVAAPRVDDVDAYFASVTDGGSVVGAVFHPALGGVLLTAIPLPALALVADDMARRRCRPKSVLGPMMACEAFALAWRRIVGDGHVLRFHLRHFELREPPPAASTSGRMRVPARHEYDLVADWHAAFAAEVHLHEEPARQRGNAMRRIEAGQVRLWDDAAVVAYAGYSGTGDTARIAPVYTPSQMRGRGYASALVASLSRELFEFGKRAIFLTTDVANPTSNRIYQNIGYRAMADHFHYELVKAAS